MARPKSRIFTAPSLAILMLAGLMSRGTIPRSWADSIASQICFAMASAPDFQG